MFDRKDKKIQIAKPNESQTTIISQGIFIDGHSFKGIGTVRIDGVYIGEMFVDGHIVVGQTGEIKGNVTANSMLVAGTVIGNIICKDEVHFTETSVIEGDIQTTSIVIDHGAGINGKLTTRKKPINEPIILDDAVKSISASPRRTGGEQPEERRRTGQEQQPAQAQGERINFMR